MNKLHNIGTGQVKCLQNVIGGFAALLTVFILLGVAGNCLGQAYPPDPWPGNPPLRDVIDTRTSESPLWGPTGTSNTVSTYNKRAVPALRWRDATDNEVKGAANMADAKKRVNASNSNTGRAGLFVHDGDSYDSGFYALTTDPVAGAADKSGLNAVCAGLDGKLLNSDPTAINYIKNAKAALNYPETTRSWIVGYGSPRWLRVGMEGDLTVSMKAGTANQRLIGKLKVTAFNKERTVASAKLESSAPPGQSDNKQATLEVYALGIRIINDRISDSKPFTKSLGKQTLLKANEWWLGSFSVPFIDWLTAAVAITAGNVDLTPRIALGTASASAEARLSSGLGAYAEVPLYSLWGFASVSFRLDWAVFDGGVVGGNSIAVAWGPAGKPLLRDAKYAKADYSTGGLGAKFKAKVGFDFWIIRWHKDFTLFYLFKHDGHSVSREIASFVKDTPLR